MKHKLTRNIGLKLVSLLVAFLIWLLVVNVDDPTDSVLFRNVKVNILNEDSVTEIDKVFAPISGETVVIKVTERKSVLERLKPDDFNVIADMENLNEMNSVPLTVTCSNAAVSWDEIEIMPSSMKVEIEPKKQVEFLVSVAISGTPQRGYEVGKTEVVQGKTVQIAGAESVLNRIGQVVVTIGVSNIDTDKRLTGTLKVIDKNGDQFTAVEMSRIQIKDANGVLLGDNSVMVDVTLWEVMGGIPVGVETTGTPAAGYEVSEVKTVPVTVDLVGTPEALARLNGKITLEDKVSVEGATESIAAELDIAKTLDEVEDLRLADGIDPAVSVTVQIEKTGDQTLLVPLSNLEVQNKPEKMALTFSPADQIAVSIHSNSGTASLKLTDIRASIDLAACAVAGDYEIPVNIELPEGYALVSDVKLMVNAREQQAENTALLENTEE